MKAMILAAGQGSRLKPYTDNCPKCLVKIAEKSLIEMTIDTLQRNNVTDITILTGYKGHMLNFPQVKTIANPQYETTNMVVTLFCGIEEMHEEVIISYGDIIYQPQILQTLIAAQGDVCVVVDRDWKKLWDIRPGNVLETAETLIVDEDGYLQEIGNQPQNLQQIQAQYIGLIKLSNDGCRLFKNLYAKLQKSPQQEIVQDRNLAALYLTDFLQLLINDGYKLTPVFIEHGWLEIDTKQEYEIYTTMYQRGTLASICDIDAIGRDIS